MAERTTTVVALLGAVIDSFLAPRGISFFLSGLTSHPTAAISFRSFSTISMLTTFSPASPKTL
jgi:hypothetical protein